MKKIIIIPVLLSCFICQGQAFKGFGKRLGKRIEKRVERKIEQKTQQKTDEAVDEIFDNTVDKKKKGNSKKSRGGNSNPGNKGRNNNQKGSSKRTKRSSQSAKDFVPGTQVVFQETFSRDAIGDFPGTWNTNSSGEVVTFNDDNTKWLKLVSKGTFTPDGIKSIPENSTLEFDLTIDDGASNFSPGFFVSIVNLKDRVKDYTKWTAHGWKENGVQVGLKPTPKSGKHGGIGRTSISNRISGTQIIYNNKNNSQFTGNNKTVHVSLWRQKTRLRVYLNDEKIWDIPRAFSSMKYNGVVFTADTRGEAYYVSNIRLAKAGADTRHKLLETGSFTTNDILFDVNRATIKSSSFKTLNEIGQVLKENRSKRLTIIGHTDSDGAAADNLKLSKRRAQSVKEYFNKNFNIASSRMQVVGKGESQPIDANNKTANRRVEFKLSN